jgi:hypothetical protein
MSDNNGRIFNPSNPEHEIATAVHPGLNATPAMVGVPIGRAGMQVGTKFIMSGGLLKLEVLGAIIMASDPSMIPSEAVHKADALIEEVWRFLAEKQEHRG